MDINSVLTITKGEIMINNVSNSQVTFSGPVHQANRLSKALAKGRGLDNNLARFYERTDGQIYLELATCAQVKDPQFFISTTGIGATNAGAARSLFKHIGVKEGVTLVVGAGTPSQTEYFVKQGQHGLVINKIA